MLFRINVGVGVGRRVRQSFLPTQFGNLGWGLISTEHTWPVQIQYHSHIRIIQNNGQSGNGLMINYPTALASRSHEAKTPGRGWGVDFRR